MSLTAFLLARIAEDEAPSWRLVPYDCPPDCCAPAGWVGRDCLICPDATSYGGTPEAIEEIARDHAEAVHRRSRVLTECEAKRRIVERASRASQAFAQSINPTTSGVAMTLDLVLADLAIAYADHPDYRDEWRP